MRRLFILAVAVAAIAVFRLPQAMPEGWIDVSIDAVEVPDEELQVVEAGNIWQHSVLGPAHEGERREVKWRHETVGRRVAVEGIAWWAPANESRTRRATPPHRGPKVIYEGGAISVPWLDLVAASARGKTVRVVGTLRLTHETRSVSGNLSKWYYIEMEGVDVIDGVSDPAIVLVEDAEMTAR